MRGPLWWEERTMDLAPNPRDSASNTGRASPDPQLGGGGCKQKNKNKSGAWGGHLWDHRGILAVEFGLNPDFCHALLTAISAQAVGRRLEPGWGDLFTK